MAITINNVRFSYPHLFQPQSRGDQEPKYSVTVLVPKSNLQAKQQMDQAIQEAIEWGVKAKWNGQRPPKPAICVHDGDGERPSDGQPFGPECKGCWVFTASSKDRPFVVDRQVSEIIDPREVYPGMWGNVNVNFFPYNYNGKKGIGCGLNGVQKTADGTPLGGGRVTARDAFQQLAPEADAARPAAAIATPAAAIAPPAAAYGQPVQPAEPQVNPFTGLPF